MPSPSSPSSSSSFSLVARDLAREHGAHTVLDGVDVSIGPRTRLGVVGPNGVGKTTLLRLLAGHERPDRGSLTATPPTLQVGYLAQEPERRDETVLSSLSRRTGVAAAEAELERAAAALADAPDDAADAYAAALDAYLAVGGPDLDARARATCDDVGLAAATPRRADARPVGRRGGARVARRDPAQPASTCSSSTSPPTTSTSPGSSDWRPFVDEPPGRRRAREPRPRVPRTHRHPCARARRAHPQGHRVRRRLARLPRRARDRTAARRGGLRRVPLRARPIGAARAHATRMGGAGGARGEEGHVARRTRTCATSASTTSEKQAAKARATERGASTASTS